MFFSIILPTFNRSYCLSTAIESVICQTTSDWELFIVDDGSTDNTSENIKQFLSDDRLRYFRIEHSGAVNAKNFGINIAEGKYVTFLDSDDEYYPEHLLMRKQLLENDEDIDALYGGLQIIGEPYVPDINAPSKLIHINDCFVGGTFFIRKEILKSLGRFPSVKYGEDYTLMQQLIERKSKIVKVEYPTYIYKRTSEDSVCLNYSNH